jgi:hypothetical protein
MADPKPPPADGGPVVAFLKWAMTEGLEQAAKKRKERKR